jgi:hypothetical protein
MKTKACHVLVFCLLLSVLVAPVFLGLRKGRPHPKPARWERMP